MRLNTFIHRTRSLKKESLLCFAVHPVMDGCFNYKHFCLKKKCNFTVPSISVIVIRNILFSSIRSVSWEWKEFPQCVGMIVIASNSTWKKDWMKNLTWLTVPRIQMCSVPLPEHACIKLYFVDTVTKKYWMLSLYYYFWTVYSKSWMFLSLIIENEQVLGLNVLYIFLLCTIKGHFSFSFPCVVLVMIWVSIRIFKSGSLQWKKVFWNIFL